jgi:protein-S-isoprenylcysteine O-methyltransferase Ste14
VIPVPFSHHPIYDAIFLTSYCFWLTFEFITGRSRKTRGAARANDRGSFAFLIAMIWVGISLEFALCFMAQGAAFPKWRVEIFFVGIALMWIGIAFRYYAMRVLGKFFTFQVTTQAGQTVVTDGPYRWIRHPSYTGAFITVIGFGLALGNAAGMAALVGCVALGYFYRIRVEERMLVESLGQPYREYMTRTARLVPFVL